MGQNQYTAITAGNVQVSGDGWMSPGEGDGGGWMSPGEGCRVGSALPGKGELYGSAAAVIDLDNILHCGHRSRRVLDVIGIVRELRQAGVKAGTVCCHFGPGALGELLWSRLGFKVVAANENVDPYVISSALGYASRGDIKKIVLIAGDGGYSATVDQLKKAGIEVEVWARRGSTSTKLAQRVSHIRWIDQFLGEQRQAAVLH